MIYRSETMARTPISDENAAERGNVTVQRAWIGRHNYVINAETVMRDAYRLLSLVLGDRALALLPPQDEHDLLVGLRDQFVEDELVHLLIGTAVMNRSHDDHMSGPRGDEDELSFAPVTLVCGTLTIETGRRGAVTEDLLLRETCNKIIHADEIRVQPEAVEGAAFPVLPHDVLLTGRAFGRSWRAVLNVPNYVRATIMNFRDIR